MSIRNGYGYPLGLMFANNAFAEAWAAYQLRCDEDDAFAVEQGAQDCLFARYINILILS
jgi:hypothetical protein